LPHQHLGEVRRRRDQHHAGDASRRRRAVLRAAIEFARKQERHPATHGRTDHDLRPAAELLEHRNAFLEPSADGAVPEIAAGFAVPRIIEADAGPALPGRPVVERLGLRAFHVRLEPAEPEQARTAAFADAHGDIARRGARSNFDAFQANVVHSSDSLSVRLVSASCIASETPVRIRFAAKGG
jgi:hypothetical protein